MTRAVDYGELSAFVVVAREGSFRRAGALLGVTASAISHSLRHLETRLGVKLLNRTTRAMSLTEAGRALFKAVDPAFQTIDTALASTISWQGRPQGTLRLNVPRLAAAMILEPVLPRYAEACPDVRLEVVLSESLDDIVGKGFDAGIRLGEYLHADMTAVALTPPFSSVVAGSPDYLQRRGIPRHPKDLLQHKCVGFLVGQDRTLYQWRFRRDSDEVTVSTDGCFATDSVDLIVKAGLDGIGLIHSFRFVIEDYLASTRLVPVLEDWCLRFPGFYLYYSGRRQTSPALRALIEMIRYRNEGKRARS